MNTASAGGRQDEVETPGDTPHQPRTESRRLLLAQAIGGLAVSASGLLLSDRLMKTEARAGAPDSARSGLHAEKRQRGQKRRRNRHDKSRKNDEDKPRGGLFRGIRFSVSVLGGSCNVEFYKGAPGIFDPSWELAGTKTVSPGSPITFQEEDGFGVLWIEGRYFLRALNVLPSGTEERVGLWGNIDAKAGHWNPGQWWETGRDFAATTRTIAGSRPVVWDDLRYVHFLRRPDSPKYLEFEVFIQPVES